MISQAKAKQRTEERTMKNPLDKAMPSLVELEAEAEEYGRKVAREYLQGKLQGLADQHGEIFPPEWAEAVASKATQPHPAHRRRGGRRATVARTRPQ